MAVYACNLALGHYILILRAHSVSDPESQGSWETVSFGSRDRLHLRAVGQQREILSGLSPHCSGTCSHTSAVTILPCQKVRLQTMLLNFSLHWRSLSVLPSYSFSRAGFREASWVELDVALGQTGNLFLELLF